MQKLKWWLFPWTKPTYLELKGYGLHYGKDVNGIHKITHISKKQFHFRIDGMDFNIDHDLESLPWKGWKTLTDKQVPSLLRAVLNVN